MIYLHLLNWALKSRKQASLGMRPRGVRLKRCKMRREMAFILCGYPTF